MGRPRKAERTDPLVDRRLRILERKVKSMQGEIDALRRQVTATGQRPIDPLYEPFNDDIPF